MSIHNNQGRSSDCRHLTSQIISVDFHKYQMNLTEMTCILRLYKKFKCSKVQRLLLGQQMFDNLEPLIIHLQLSCKEQHRSHSRVIQYIKTSHIHQTTSSQRFSSKGKSTGSNGSSQSSWKPTQLIKQKRT